MKIKLKKIWKLIMRLGLKIYTNNYRLYIQSESADSKKEKFYSQFGQDLFVLNNTPETDQQKTFVDVGGNHPLRGNNTYLLETDGWHGIAIEPQEKLRNLWPSFRKTPCLNYVIGPENKLVDFIEASADKDGLSGVAGFNKCNNIDCQKITVQQKRLTDILMENKIDRIDYLSIDVEGYELKVLESIDFSKVDIRLIGLENDLGFKWLPFFGQRLGQELGDNKIRKFLKARGYTYVARIVCDDFFIKIK
jgi:FkbM family methyltransferase